MNESRTFAPLVYYRIYADARAKWGWYGESHFDRVKVDQSPVNAASSAPLLNLSRDEPASVYLFCSLEPEWTSTWQPAPVRQFLVVLSGSMEVEVSDGEMKRFQPGDSLLLEDTWGKGHRWKNSGEDVLHLLVVQLPIRDTLRVVSAKKG
jgi:quercetin dioxygenase-like cupin family protein